MSARKSDESQERARRTVLEIAQAFPDCFHIWGERISVREDAGTEMSRALARQALGDDEKQRDIISKKT